MEITEKEIKKEKEGENDDKLTPHLKSKPIDKNRGFSSDDEETEESSKTSSKAKNKMNDREGRGRI